MNSLKAGLERRPLALVPVAHDGAVHLSARRRFEAGVAGYAGRRARVVLGPAVDKVRFGDERAADAEHIGAAVVKQAADDGERTQASGQYDEDVLRRAAERVLGPDAVGSYRGTLSGEDFSRFLNRVPGVLAFVGTRNPAIGAAYPQHSCFYTVDESVLVNGSMLAAQYAVDFLAE